MAHGGSINRGGSGGVVFVTTIADSMQFVHPVAAEIAHEGHVVHLVSGDRSPSAKYPHTSAVLPMNRRISPGADAGSLRRFVDYLKAVRPKMIVAGTPKASLLGLTAARIAGVPIRVYVIHGAVWDVAGRRRRTLETAERATIAASTHQIAVSDSLARLIRARGISRCMPEVLGSGSFCGVDVSRFVPQVSSARPDPVMCFVGRVNRDKGIDVLLRTLDRVRERIDATLTVVGGLDTTAPPDEATMEAMAAHPHINWVGEVSNVEDYLRSSNILLFPTSREGLGQVTLEAQACGVPVVSWRVTGVIDAVRDGFTGVLVPFGDEVALAEAAVSLLENPSLRGQMSENARGWVASRFAQSDVATRNAEYLIGQLMRDQPP